MKRERCILGPIPSEGVVGARLHCPGSRAFPRPGFHPGPSWHLSCPRGSLSHNSGGRHSLKGLSVFSETGTCSAYYPHPLPPVFQVDPYSSPRSRRPQGPGDKEGRVRG